MTPWTDIKYQYVNEPLDRDDQIIYLDVRYVLNPQLMIKTIQAYLSSFQMESTRKKNRVTAICLVHILSVDTRWVELQIYDNCCCINLPPPEPKIQCLPCIILLNSPSTWLFLVQVEINNLVVRLCLWSWMVFDYKLLAIMQ